MKIIRKTAAVLALMLSLVLCAAAGRMPEGTAVLSTLDGSSQGLRLDYLHQLGWEVENEREEYVVLPQEFGSGYQDYLAIQRECGFDLEPLAGETVTRYCYTILNYPTGEEGVCLDLLVCRGRIVGGDVRSAQLDGFMHSLKREF